MIIYLLMKVYLYIRIIAKYRLVGLIINNTQEIWIYMVQNLSSESMKNYITSLIPKGNKIINNVSTYYNWLNDADNGYKHSVHNHRHRNFGDGLDSTSHIEQLWHNLKYNITSNYNIIPS